MKLYLRSLTTKESGLQMVRLGLIGVLNTVAFFVLFNTARIVFDISLNLSITIAFAIATLMSYVLNRRWTFGLEKNSGGVKETFDFFLVNIVAWAVTLGIVNLAELWFGPLEVIGENVASLFAAGVTLVPKFASYRDIVFRKALRPPPADQEQSAEVLANLPHPTEGPGNPA